MAFTELNDVLAFGNQFFENLGLPELEAQLIVSVLAFIGFLIIGWIIEHIFEHYFKIWAKKTKTKIDDEILNNVKRPIYILVLFFGIFFFANRLNTSAMLAY